jgi:GDP-L-fucose synthase
MSYEGKKVLVTGGTGFVGTALVKRLLERGARVRVTVHRRQPPIDDPRIETVAADLVQLDDCRAAARGMDYVFHAAGAVAAAGISTNGLMDAISTNLVLLLRILQAAWDEGVQRIQVFSSSTAYPAADHPIAEEEMWGGPTYPGYFGYGWSRRYMERVSEFVASKSALGVALVRPTAVYGPWDNFDPRASHVIPALVRRAVAREDPYVVWGTGDEVRDFLHVDDLADGCLALLAQHAVCDPVNIGYGHAVTIREVVATILKAAGHEGARVVFDATKPGTIPFRMVDTAKAARLLGFAPRISLEQGLADTVRWYQGSQGLR